MTSPGASKIKPSTLIVAVSCLVEGYFMHIAAILGLHKLGYFGLVAAFRSVRLNIISGYGAGTNED